MFGIVITGGEAPPYYFVAPYLRKAGIIVAADSGFDVCLRYGIMPDILVGDLDSIKNETTLLEIFKGNIKKASRDKDHTDTELALQQLKNAGVAKQMIIGGGGGRIDHLWALFHLFDEVKIPTLWMNNAYSTRLITDSLTLKGACGEVVSFFSVGSGETRMSSEGLKWPLDNVVWCNHQGGISNKIVSNEMNIKMKCGRIIMVCKNGLIQEF